MVKVREGEQGEQYLPIYSWSPFGGSQQWGVLFQTAGNLSTGDMKAVLRAFCGDSHRMYVISTRYESESSHSAAQQAKALIESGKADAPLNVHEASPCYNPNEDNINLDQTDDQQDRNNRWLLVWQKCAECAKNNGGRMIQIVDSNIGLSDMQRAEEEIATLLELEITRINSEQLRTM